MKRGLYVIARDVEASISFKDAEIVSKYDDTVRFNFYNGKGEKVISDVNFSTLKTKNDVY